MCCFLHFPLLLCSTVHPWHHLNTFFFTPGKLCKRLAEPYGGIIYIFKWGKKSSRHRNLLIRNFARHAYTNLNFFRLLFLAKWRKFYIFLLYIFQLLFACCYRSSAVPSEPLAEIIYRRENFPPPISWQNNTMYINKPNKQFKHHISLCMCQPTIPFEKGNSAILLTFNFV